MITANRTEANNISNLYSEESVDRIRETAREILRDSGLSRSKAVEKINENLTKQGRALHIGQTIFGRLCNFGTGGAHNQSLDLALKLPYLIAITDRYSDLQLRAIALGRKEIGDLEEQEARNRIWRNFFDCRGMILEEAREIPYYQTTELPNIFFAIQIERIGRTVRRILEKENAGQSRAKIAEEITLQAPESGYLRTTLNRLANYGADVTNSGLDLLGKLPYLALVSREFDESALRSIALGGCPSPLEEEEKRETEKYRKVLSRIYGKARLEFSLVMQDVGQYRANNTPMSIQEYLHHFCNQEGISWEEGTRRLYDILETILSEGEIAVIQQIINGDRVAFDRAIIPDLRWGLYVLSGELIDFKDLRAMIEKN